MPAHVAPRSTETHTNGTTAMFDLTVQATGQEGGRQKPVPSVAWGHCPDCTNGKVGLQCSGGHYTWRQHWFKTWGNTTRLCRASAAPLCTSPAKGEPTRDRNGAPVTCPCGVVPV